MPRHASGPWFAAGCATADFRSQRAPCAGRAAPLDRSATRARARPRDRVPRRSRRRRLPRPSTLARAAPRVSLLGRRRWRRRSHRPEFREDAAQHPDPRRERITIVLDRLGQQIEERASCDVYPGVVLQNSKRLQQGRKPKANESCMFFNVREVTYPSLLGFFPAEKLPPDTAAQDGIRRIGAGPRPRVTRHAA
jgi:hypothetical protein